MRRYNPEPQFIVARYPGVCAETGKAIRKGDTVVWHPASGKLYCESSDYAATVRGIRFSETWGMGDANW